MGPSENKSEQERSVFMRKLFMNSALLLSAFALVAFGAFSWPTQSTLQVSRASATNDWCKIVPIKQASASKTAAGSSVNYVFDGNLNTAWNSGDFPMQWIEVTLDGVYDIYGVQMKTEQLPAGVTSHEIYAGGQWPNQTMVMAIKQYTDTAQWMPEEFTTQKSVTKVTVMTKQSPSWVAWREIQVCGQPSSSTPPPPVTPPPTPTPCPAAYPIISTTQLNVGQSATISYPQGWTGGSFQSSNTNIVQIQGNTIRALEEGSAQVYGMGMRVGNAWPCTTTPVTITVKKPVPEGRMWPGYQVFSVCRGATSFTINAWANTPSEIRFDRTVKGGNYRGTRQASVSTPDGNGGFTGRLVVRRDDFPLNDQVWFRLYANSGQALFEGQYVAIAKTDNNCN